MKRVLALCCALALCAALIPLSAGAATNVTMYVVTSNKGELNLRSSCFAPANNLIIKIPYGAQVTVTGYIDATWCSLLYTTAGRTYSGYAQYRYLSAARPSDAPDATVENSLDYSTFVHVSPYNATVYASTAGGFVNLRWAPSKSVAVMARIYDGGTVTVLSQGSGWYQVQDVSTGYVGFIMSYFVH